MMSNAILATFAKQDLPTRLNIAVGIQMLVHNLGVVSRAIWDESGIIHGFLNMAIAVVAICGFPYAVYLGRINRHMCIIVGAAAYLAAHLHWLFLLEHVPLPHAWILALWATPNIALIIGVVRFKVALEARFTSPSP